MPKTVLSNHTAQSGRWVMDEMGNFTFYGNVYCAAGTMPFSRKDKVGNGGGIVRNGLKDIKREGMENEIR